MGTGVSATRWLMAGAIMVTGMFPATRAAEPGEALRLRFRIEGVGDTWDLATRARGEIAQVFLHDSPWLQINLNVTRQKTTVHFFLPAERAENGPWVAADLRGLEGLAAERGTERVKVAALDLARLRGGVDYELVLNRDDAAGALEVFLNGERQGDVLPANKGRWTPERAERELRDVGGKLGQAEVWVLVDERIVGGVSEARARELAADLAAPKVEGRSVRTGGIDLGPVELDLIAAEDFAVGGMRVIAERELFDGEGERRVREPGANEWVLEGAGSAELRGGGLRMVNGGEEGATGGSGHLVLWAPWELPGDYLVEYDFEPEDARRGLHILFWSARHRDGGSLFAEGRRKRDGVFGEYLWRGIDSYHASIFATDDDTPRRVANLRKNDGFVLSACGADRIAGRGAAAGAVRVRLLKLGAKMTLEVDGVTALEWEDDGRANGPALGGGRIGFRTMAHTGAVEISKVRVFAVRERVVAGAAAETMLDFVGMQADGPPAGAVAGGGANMSLAKDNALDAEGFWTITAPADGDDFVEARVPLVGAREAGRYTVTLRARSAERKWLLVSLRDGERELWTQAEQLAANTREFRHEAVLAAGEGERSLVLRFRGPGSVEVAMARVEAVNPERLVAAAEARWPEGAPANLLRHSRLPLGLPTGWALDRHFDDEGEAEFGVDEREPGALLARVSGGRRVILNTEPFLPALAGREHTAGFAVKGSGRGSVVVVADGRERGKPVEFEAGENWKTVTAGFEADPLARVWHLRLRLEGELWLDRFQVNDGDALREGAVRAEVTLAAGTRSRVHAVDEAVEASRVAWAVTDAPEGARLAARVVSIYGDVRELPEVALCGGLVVERGELDYAVFAGRPFGVFRVEARVVDAAGRALGSEAEVVVHRVRRARHAGEFAPESPFGVHTLPTARHLEMAKAIGLNWVRLHDAGGLEWFGLEPKRGEWRFNDTVVRRYRGAWFEILGVLGTAPLWANAWPGEDKQLIHGFWDKWGAPGDLDAWANYATTVAGRYREEIRAFEVWNEPWIPRFFSGRREPQAVGEPVYFHGDAPQFDYAELSRRAADAVRASGSGARVIGLNSTAGEGISNRISGTGWAAGVAEADGIQKMDAVSYHHYSTARLGYPGDDVEAGLSRALGPLAGEHGLAKPVWLTEGANSPGGLAETFYRHTLPMETSTDVEALADSAEGLVRYVVVMLAAGNERVFLYSMHAHGFFGERLRFTTLVTPDGFLHPDAAAFAAMAWQVEGRRLVGREAVEDATVYRFVGKEGDAGVTVVLPHAGRAVVPGAGAVDLWGNPADGRATGRVFYGAAGGEGAR